MFVLIQNFHIPTVAMLYRLQLQNIQDHHCFYQQTARYPKPVKVYRESKTNPVTPTLTLLKWLIECHKNVDPFGSYPVEKAQNVPFTESGKVKLTFL